MHPDKNPLSFRRLDEWVKYYLVPGRLYIANLVRRNMRKGQHELSYMRDYFANPDKIFVDVGANKGLWSWVLASNFAEVHAFEANPKNFRLLTKWHRANVFPHAVALSDQDAVARLGIPYGEQSFSDNMSSLQPLAGMREYAEIAVTTRRLDSCNLSQIGLIKIDVEGHEEAVLQGAWGVIERDWPVLVIEMLESPHQPPLTQRMAPLFDRGYVCHYVRKGQLIRLGNRQTSRTISNTIDGLYCRDFIFIHENQTDHDFLKT